MRIPIGIPYWYWYFLLVFPIGIDIRPIGIPYCIVALHEVLQAEEADAVPACTVASTALEVVVDILGVRKGQYPGPCTK